MTIIITGPGFKSNLALMHALQDLLPAATQNASVKVVDWGRSPAVIHPRDQWFVLVGNGGRDLPEGALWPEEPYCTVDADQPLDAQVEAVFAVLPDCGRQ